MLCFHVHVHVVQTVCSSHRDIHSSYTFLTSDRKLSISSSSQRTPFPLLFTQLSIVPFQTAIKGADRSESLTAVVYVASWRASSSDDESCISTSNLRALLDEGVSLQPGVVTESKLIAETSVLARFNCGNGVGKLKGGTCFGAPERKLKTYIYCLLTIRKVQGKLVGLELNGT